MKKYILITGSTDGIGLETAKLLVSKGHHVLLHGRNSKKLEEAERTLSALKSDGSFESYLADLSSMNDVDNLAKTVINQHEHLDVLINNAGILKTPEPIKPDGLDVRFVVNTLAPYLLTTKLVPILGASGRVVNLSSSAQSPVDHEALTGRKRLSDMDAYAQSKLAITMWSRYLAEIHKDDGPAIIAVNPGSMLGTKMVKEGFGVSGHNIGIGADILYRAALSEEFSKATGLYFDNDSRQFSSPHHDATDILKCQEIVRVIETVLT